MHGCRYFVIIMIITIMVILTIIMIVMITWSPVNVQEPNFIMQVCWSNGK